ncbi:MAG: helix-turn-helix domain-containing protein [Symbiobacteriaceae bacterium]|nr:helix-turn-helix domain-containing protein [Symbiobacteriaceae bacterium]
MRTLESSLAERLKDPEFKKAYDDLEPEFSIIRALIEARRKSGLTQKQLSSLSGVAQGDISKMENGNANPSLRTLQRLASAMDMHLKVEFVSPDNGIQTTFQNHVM